MLMNLSGRWVLLASFSLSLIASGFAMVGFASVSTIIADIYDTGAITLTLTTLIFLVEFVPMNFVVINQINTRGLRFCLLIAPVLTIVGGWMRQVISFYPHFWVVLIGTIPLGIGQPYLINSVSKLTSVWFGENEVNTPTSSYSSSLESLGHSSRFLIIPYRMCARLCSAYILVR